jgi:hypothetical protein
LFQNRYGIVGILPEATVKDWLPACNKPLVINQMGKKYLPVEVENERQ